MTYLGQISRIPGLQLAERSQVVDGQSPPICFFTVLMVGLASLVFCYYVLQVIQGYWLVGELVALSPKFMGGKTLAVQS